MVTGSHGPKRTQADRLDEVQKRNREWWEATPMDYDWRRVSGPEPLSEMWFDDQDRKFVEASRHFATTRIPFDRLIPFSALQGKRVLEVGIGSGLHSELLARAGATVVGIDLSRAAVQRTQRRFELKGLVGTFEQVDAELPRPAFRGQFDFVWSWGVIHHSSRTARIVRNVQEWLVPQGAFAGMVYHRDSTAAAGALVKDWVLRRNFPRHSVDEALWRGTDGYSARFYPADQWCDLLLGFFHEACVHVTGGISDALPLPRRARAVVAPRVPPSFRDWVLERFGSFVVFEARLPIGTGLSG